MSRQLESAAEVQGEWSATGDALKKSYGQAHVTVSVLSTAAALRTQAIEFTLAVITTVITAAMSVSRTRSARAISSR